MALNIQDPKNKIAIIGGGITGLVFAWSALKRGEYPVLFDPAFTSESTAGGVMLSVNKDGFTLERGPNTLVLTPEMRSLIDDLKLNDRIKIPAVPKYKQYIWYNGAVHSVPRSTFQLFRSKLFPGIEKIKALRGVFSAAKGHLISDNTTVASLFEQLFSKHISKNILAPVLRGIFGGDIDKLITSKIFPKLWVHLNAGGTIFGYMREKMSQGRREIFAIEGGNAELVKGLISALNDKVTFVDSSVVSLSLTSASQFIIVDSKEQSYTFPKVVVATSGSATARYIGSLSSELQVLLNQMRYAAVAVVHLAISSKEVLPKAGFGLLFPPNEGALMGVLFNSILFPHVAPAGKALVTVCLGGVGQEVVLSLSEKELISRAQGALKQYLNINKSDELLCTKWPKGIPQYEGCIVDLHAEMAKITNKIPGITFVGADIGGIGVPARIERALMTI